MAPRHRGKPVFQLSTLYKGPENWEAANNPPETFNELSSFPPLYKGGKLESWTARRGDHPSRALTPLAELFARAYLRLLSAGQKPRIAPIAAPRESPAGSPNCLDVADPTKHQLDRRLRP